MRATSVARVQNFINSTFHHRAAWWEPWQLHHQVEGVFVTPLYDSMPGLKLGGAPLEIKVVTIWGTVIGATLATHPLNLWISASGEVHGTKFSCRPHCRYWRAIQKNAGGGALPRETRERLLRLLPTEWPHIRATSEQIATHLGMDELRAVRKSTGSREIHDAPEVLFSRSHLNRFCSKVGEIKAEGCLSTRVEVIVSKGVA